jgi:hypothetical protein
MDRRLAIAIVGIVVLVAATGGFATFRDVAPPEERHNSSPSTWTEVAWPFPVDQWGRGKAFVCKPADCGSAVIVYLRAKLGFCNCTTGVADDDDLDRMSDFDLVTGEVSPLAAGRPVRIGGMKGRDRAYSLTASKPGKTAISIVFNDRCDMVVATAVLSHDRPEAIDPVIIEFLNSGTVLNWAQVSLGL